VFENAAEQWQMRRQHQTQSLHRRVVVVVVVDHASKVGTPRNSYATHHSTYWCTVYSTTHTTAAVSATCGVHMIHGAYERLVCVCVCVV
jgi:hypothetical protein